MAVARVGKTSLIARFVEDKPAVVFTAQESSAKENLVAFSRAVFELSEASGLSSTTSYTYELDAAVPVYETFRCRARSGFPSCGKRAASCS